MFFNWSAESSTRLRIPFEEISKIEKLYNAFIFDNSIGIWLKGKEKNKDPCIFLTSFLQRDDCYDLTVNHCLSFKDRSEMGVNFEESKGPKSTVNIYKKSVTFNEVQSIKLSNAKL